MTDADLTHYEPSFVRWFTPADGRVSYHLYYGVPDGDCSHLDIGQTFSMVYSPNPYWKERNYWRLVVYEAVISYPRWTPKNPGEQARMYREVSQRALSEREVAQVQVIVEQTMNGEQDVTEQLWAELGRTG